MKMIRLALILGALVISTNSMACIDDPTGKTDAAAAAPVVAAAPEAAKPIDPCAAYMASYESYVVCQDRVLKIKRMQDAKLQRDTADKPPVVEPEKAPEAKKPETPAVADDKAAAPAAPATTSEQK
jgi:hypothetical protein